MARYASSVLSMGVSLGCIVYWEVYGMDWRGVRASEHGHPDRDNQSTTFSFNNKKTLFKKKRKNTYQSAAERK